jgi:hypothetical protein
MQGGTQKGCSAVAVPYTGHAFPPPFWSSKGGKEAILFLRTVDLSVVHVV